jgi:hypothetical protein
MRKFMTKKVGIIFAGVLATMLAAGAAFAYWTAGGSGEGTAETGTTAELTINQTDLEEELAPGVPAQTLEGTFGNTNDGPVYVTSVTASIASVTQAENAVGDCDVDDYTLTDELMLVNDEVAVGDPMGAWSGATLAFNNTGANQDGCKGATVNLAYEIDAAVV